MIKKQVKSHKRIESFQITTNPTLKFSNKLGFKTLE